MVSKVTFSSDGVKIFIPCFLKIPGVKYLLLLSPPTVCDSPPSLFSSRHLGLRSSTPTPL